MSAGKGSSPRNCFSKNFKDNYSEINWGKNKQTKHLWRIESPEDNFMFFEASNQEGAIELFKKAYPEAPIISVGIFCNL